MKKLTLVILAAGMGSRYGGLKQLDVMCDGDTIIDFSIYDAIEAGFSKIVFVVRESFKDEFKKLFKAKLNNQIEVAYVCQEVKNTPLKFSDNNREKPWGTGHALLMAKNEIEGNFAVINADDFYGKDAFKVMATKLQSIVKKTTKFLMIGYRLKNTISENGAVSRGECYIDENQFLEKIIERTHIEKRTNKLCYKNEENRLVNIDDETTVSMNFWGFTPQLFSLLESQFYQFLKESKDDLKKEFFIPSVIGNLIENNKISVEVLQSDSKWLGVTYKEDKPQVVEGINKLKEKGCYPKQLW